jgi:hypothetical protein
MSKRINVNPDHYKSAGRERPDDAARERVKQRPPAPPLPRPRAPKDGKNLTVSARRKPRSPGA